MRNLKNLDQQILCGTRAVRRSLLLLALLAFFGAGESRGLAQTYTNVETGTWSQNATWGTNSYPSGSVAMVTIGTGTVTINDTESVTELNGPFVEGATLVIANGGSLSVTGGGLNIGQGTSATLNIESGGSYSGTLNISGTLFTTTLILGNSVNLSSTIDLDNTLTTAVEVDGTDQATISGPILHTNTNANSLDKTGTGTLILTGTNTYNGGTTISAGVLQVQTDGALGTAAVTVDSGGTLSLYNQVTVTNNITISGTGSSGQGAITSSGNFQIETISGTVTLVGNATVGNAGSNSELSLGPISLGTSTLTVGTGSGIFELNGTITGSGGLSIDASYATINGGNNTFSGTTDVEAGAVLNLSDTAGTAVSGALTIENGATVDDQPGGELSSATVITLNGSGTFLFDSYFGNSFSETVAGLVSTTNSSLITTQPPDGSGSASDSLILTGTNTYSYAGQITDSTMGLSTATLSLTLDGTGTQILSGNNTYTGGTTIDKGILEISSESNIGTGGLTLGGGELLTNSNATFTLGVTLDAGTNTLAAFTGATATFNGVISGSNALTINDGTNDGTVALNEANTYSGGTTIVSGTVVVGTNNAFGSGTVITEDPTITYTNSVTMTNPIDMEGDTTLEVDGTNSATQAGVISGTDTALLTKAGTGTLTLSAANTYAGSTTISAGTLIYTGDTSGLGGAIVDDAALVFNQAANSNFYNGISGTGTLTKEGAGSLVLDSSNSYSGGTTISGGQIVAGTNAALGSGAVTLSGGTLVGGAGVTTTNAINLGSGGGSLGNYGAYAQTTFTGAITLSSNNLTIFSYSLVPATTTVSGGITGTGNLTLVSGGATVDNTASVIISGASVDNTGTITNSGPGNGGTTISADIGANVTGVIQDSATSSLTLSGVNTYAGPTTISAGTLEAGSSSALGTGNVALNNGTLTTTGLGTGIQVNIGGNYTQAAGTTLLLNLYSPTNYDSLNLTNAGGVATVGGTLELNLVGDFAPGSGEKFAVITTSNQINGTFASVTTSQPSIQLTVDYTNDVTVLFQAPFATLPGTNYTPNQKSVATYIDQHDLGSTNPGFNNLVGALNSLSGNPSALGPAFDQLTTVKFAHFASSTAFNNASFSTGELDSYFANHRGADGAFVSSAGGIDDSGLSVNDPNVDPGLQGIHSRLLAWSPPPSTGLLSDTPAFDLGGTNMNDSKSVVETGEEPANRWNFFISGNVVLAQDFSDSAAGTAHADATTGAVQAGLDYQITPHFLVGAMFAYGHTYATLDDLGSNATVDTYSPGVYASFSQDGWYANALGSYGFADYDQNRNVSIGTFSGTASSHPGGSQIVGDLDGGYDFHRGGWTFGPTLGAQYVHLKVDGFTETGLPGADLTVNQDEADSLRSSLGGRISYAIKDGGLLFNPHFSASWQHDFMDQSRGLTSQFSDIGAGSFVVQTPNPSRDSALVDVGLDAQFNETLTIFSDYTVQAGQSDYFGQSVEAGIKIGF